MLILNSSDVGRALPMIDAIEGMKRAFTALQRGEILMPARTHLHLENHEAISLVMPSYVAGELEVLAVKVVGIFPNNLAKGLDRILGALMLFDPETGAPVAVLEGATLTGIRTAAASGAATDLLARPNCRRLGVVGSGVQAMTHIEAMCAIRPIESIKIYGPTQSKVEKLVNEVIARPDLPNEITAVVSGDQAVTEVDIVCAVTSSSTPVFSDAALAAGTHVNAVGSSQTTAAEVPPETVVRAKVVVDQRLAAWDEAGDLVQPIQNGLITKEHVLAELGELTSGAMACLRTNDEDVTFFKSVGLAMQDAFAGHLCWQSALKAGLGQTVNW